MLDRTPPVRTVRARFITRARARQFAGTVGALACAALAAAAWATGAKCPASTGAAIVTPQYSNGLLRCQRVAIAPPTCPSTHLDYEVSPGADVCRLARNAAAAGTRTATPLCPANMDRVIDAGSSSRDLCRGRSEFVPPLLGDY